MGFENEIKKEFPVCSNYTYLNTAASGLLPRTVYDWRQQHDLAFLKEGSVFRENHKDHIWEVKEKVATFFNTRKHQVALVPNFSIGLNILLEGIPRGQRILMIEGDYPSVNWPVESRDFDVSYVALDAHLEDRIATAFQKYKPDVFMCSLVQYISGISIDLEFLKTLKKEYPETIFIGDGTQFFGTSRFDFQKSAFDVVGASSYKWLLAGYGNGFFIFREGVEERLFPKAIGYNSTDSVFGNSNEINLVGRLEPGHQDTLNFGSLGKALDYLESLNMHRVEKYLQQLSETVFLTLKEQELLEPKVANRTSHSTIFNIKGDQHLFNKLQNEKILCSMRGEGIRVSFHVYNTLVDLEKLLSVISQS